MSFSVNFTATSKASAQDQLRRAYAPHGVKALVELLLAGMPWPRQAQAAVAKASTDIAASCGPARRFVGAKVEIFGHFDDSGAEGRSYIDRFVVEPLYEN